MSRRESGWYRVWVNIGEDPVLRRYHADEPTWIDCAYGDGAMIEVDDNFYDKIDQQMVMTPSGELVYHRNEHDPLYNTSQEG